jgi:hypothetical protein
VSVSNRKRGRYRLRRVIVAGWISSTEQDEDIEGVSAIAWLLRPARPLRTSGGVLFNNGSTTRVEEGQEGQAPWVPWAAGLTVATRVATFERGQIVECEQPARAKDGTWAGLTDKRMKQVLGRLMFYDLSRSWLN